jgi:hypothetical protein
MASGLDCADTTCVEDGCGVYVPLVIWKALFDTTKFLKLEARSIDKFVEIQEMLQYCVGKDCRRVIEQKHRLVSKMDVECSDCMTNFCFSCKK